MVPVISAGELSTPSERDSVLAEGDATLAENVEFGSEEDYREKLITLRESYFPSNVVTQRSTQDYMAEETDYSQPVTGMMGTYLQALERVSKK